MTSTEWLEISTLSSSVNGVVLCVHTFDGYLAWISECDTQREETWESITITYRSAAKVFLFHFSYIRSTPPNTTSCLALIGSRALVAFKTNSLLLLALVEFSACFCIVRARLFFMRRIFFNFHIAELYRHEVEIVVSLTHSLLPRYSGDTLGRVVKRQSWEEGALLWLQKAEKERESRN